MDRRKDGIREHKRRSSERSRNSQENVRGTRTSPPPTFLTSFPSFSPQDTSKMKRKTPTPQRSPPPEGTDSTKPTGEQSKQKSRAVSSPVTSKKTGSTGNGNTGDSALNRTVQAAVNLRRTIMDSITMRQSSQNTSTTRIFLGPDENIGDPLAGASDEHVQRIITSSGGAVATIKKYSADLAESNERVATERNSKLRLVEENRQLRTQLSDKDLEIDDMRRQRDVAKQLFQRYVAKMEPNLSLTPSLQVIDSPAGPYALEDESGTILATFNDDFIFPDSTPVDTPDNLSVADGQTTVQRGKCKSSKIFKLLDISS
jgi:hypothetical protein